MEFVFVIPRPDLFPESYPHGVVLFGAEASEAPEASGTSEEAFGACVRDKGFFVERTYAERTPGLKQVIPYSLVVRRGAEGAEVLCLRRTKAGGEARLHDKLSIGVGGHINPQDMSPDLAEGGDSNQAHRGDPIAAATHREVAQEELSIEGPYTVHRVGLLNDDSNPVGAVHVGLVQVIVVEGVVTIREVDQLEGSFVSVAELHRLGSEGANFETWSSLLLPHLDQFVSITAVGLGTAPASIIGTSARTNPGSESPSSEGEVLTACPSSRSHDR